MSRPRALALALLASGLIAPIAAAREGASNGLPLVLQKGDRICLVGNALAERMQHHGWLETHLQLRHPEHELSFRNLGFGGDEVSTWHRVSGFGSRDEWLERCGADVVFAFFGYNESFRDEAGLAAFRKELEEFVDHTRATSYGDAGSARLVLFSSIPFENHDSRDLPDGSEHNERIRRANDILAEVAGARQVPFVDLYAPMLRHYAEQDRPLTLNGIHLTEEGNRLLGIEISQLFRERFLANEFEVGDPRVLEVVLEKNLLWFNRYRATDGYNVYGGRSALKYTDDISNFDVLQREMEILDALCDNRDRKIQARAWGGELHIDDDNAPPPIAVTTNRPGEGPGGAYRFLDSEAAIQVMTPAPGMKINLFAGEEQFPELANPVQMAFDTRGRLWVAGWPTYPHWKPGQPMNDKLVILSDEDGDGRADRSTVFADDLHNPTGFEFWNGGVVVANCPDLLFLKDEDGDDIADSREQLLHGISSGDTHHSANSFVLGPDGALYFQEGTFHRSQIESIHGPVRNRDGCVWRFEPRTWKVERYVAYGFANPHGHVFDRWGQDFVTDGTGNVNYYALPFSGHLDSPARHAGYFPFFQQRSRPCAGTEILSSSHFPAENQGNYLVANVIGFRGIFQYRVEEDGSGFKGIEVDPLVFSEDPSFRPADIEVGPDGAVYFLDWHNPIIGHMQHHLRDPSRDRVHGRVYRVTWEGRPLTAAEDLHGRPIAGLLELLESPDDRLRYRSRIELSARDSDEVARAVDAWVERLDPSDAEREHHLLEGLWVKQQHHRPDRELLVRLLNAEDHRARAAATRVLRCWRDEVANSIELLRASSEDAHPRVRLEALVAASFFRSAEAVEIVLAMHDAVMGEDRFLRYAMSETLKGLEPIWRPALVAGKSIGGSSSGLDTLLARLGTAELRTVRESPALFRQMLSRHDLPADELKRALAGLARLSGDGQDDLLMMAIRSADARTNGHVDHLLSNLFGCVDGLPAAEMKSLEPTLEEFASDGQRTSTRRLATAALIRVRGSLEQSWRDAVRSIGAMNDLLEAAPLVNDPALAGDLFGRIRTLLDAPPPELAGSPDRPLRTAGRYLRIEIPGAGKTLTLAEVEVLSDGRNIAASGKASQSSVAWSGVAARAIDGNRGGKFGDGGQTHTVEGRPDPWWELDLGGERPIDSVVIWNRSEQGGKFASRLDGCVVRVLDGQRRTLFQQQIDKAAAESMTVELSDGALALRRAAIRTLPALGVRQQEAVGELVARFGESELRGAILESLGGVPLDRWPSGTPARLGRELLPLLAAARPEEFDDDRSRGFLALAQRLEGSLDQPLRRQLERARKRLGPQVFVIRPIRDSILYDITSLSVVAGRRVEIVFDNTDIMPHNLVVTAIGALARVGMAAEAMAAKPDAWDRAFVPDLAEVLFATGLLQPGQSETLEFTAPDVPGDYPYVCTFPGHWVRMNGIMHVVSEEQAERQAAATPVVKQGPDPVEQVAPVAVKRTFVRNWSSADLLPYLENVNLRSAARGRKVLEAATCLVCHQAGGQGGVIGPELEKAVSAYSRADLLAHILEPSKLLAEEYVNQIFFTHAGDVVAGRVVSESGVAVEVQVDPYGSAGPMKLLLKDVKERKRSTISTMPAGLLSTFKRNDILDLLAYLESLKKAGGKGE